MSRKFNIGRQSDLLLNEKLHNLYTHLEFISYKDGDGNTITVPRQTKQTAIPKGALWLQHPFETNTHKLRVHTNPDASDMEERWPCLFEGYYHPATLKEMPKDPVHGQLWIDDKNVLRVYNSSAAEGKWDLVLTGEFTQEKYDVFNGLDFQLIDPLLPIELDTGEELSVYAVPYESFGKYYTAKNHNDEFIYCHPGQQDGSVIPNYNPQTSENVISVDGESDLYEAKAWVHINPYNVDKITKRLIKITKPSLYYKSVDPKYTIYSKKNENDEDIYYIIEKHPDYENITIRNDETDGSLYIMKDGVRFNVYTKDVDKYNFINFIEIRDEKDNKVELEIHRETRVLKVVTDSIMLSQLKPSAEIKVSIANNNKYIQTIDFKIDDYVQPTLVRNQNTGFIAIPAGKTEYFAFKSKTSNKVDDYDNKIGRLLKRYSLKEGLTDEDVNNNPTILDYRNDYEIKNGGILLDNDIVEEYDYIYAITYEFRANHSIDGNLVRIYKNSLDGPDQIFVGSVSGVPVVFMDGLYLEHYGYDGSSIYTYDNESIVFAGNDVLDNMQIMVVSFPKVNTYVDDRGILYPKEYDITTSTLVRNDDGTVDIVIKDSGSTGSLFDEENFPNPLIFYNGLAGYTFVANEVDIDYDAKTLTIHNYGSIPEIKDDLDLNADGNIEEFLLDEGTVFAVSLGKNNYKGYGVLEQGVLYHEAINADDAYLVIVDGIVMSPYNEDITVEDGKITITDASVALDSECTFIRLTDKDDDSLLDDTDAIMCIYDDMFAPYSIPIKNRNILNSSNAYDDCDSAIVMCGPGVLVDRESIQRDFDAQDVFIGGQIIKKRLKSVTGDEVYEWRMYTHSNEYTVLDPAQDASIIADCENMITYYANDGTVLLNPVNIDDQPVTVYAYTYVDSVDERQLRGQRLIPIDVKGHSSKEEHLYYTNRTHLYDVGVNALSVYINGVLTPHEEEPTTDIKGDLFFVKNPLSCPFVSFINRYREEHVDNRYSNQDMYNVIMLINENTTLDDTINIQTNTARGYKEVLVTDFFNSEYQLKQAIGLKNYILNDMKNNSLLYMIENVEYNEFVSCRRQWELSRNDNGNLPNSYIATTRLVPGIINVYVNGVLLEKSEYAIFDNNKIMIGFDLVGGQEIMPVEKGDYAYPYRVVTNEGFKYIECENNDVVTLEVRDDLTVKKRTYTIKEISYETHAFDIIDYEFPTSLSYTKDVIKIYINGVLYDGDYTNINGVITLLDCDLEEDPLYKYLKVNPSAMKKYEERYGEYIKYEDTITFEWR